MTFDEFLPKVLPYVPGCPTEMALDHIIEAARTFCAKTLVWNYEATPVYTVAGQSLYGLDLDDGTERVKLRGAWLDGSEITTVDALKARNLVRGGRGGLFAWIDGNYDLYLNPTPTVGGQKLVVEVAVKPSIAATEWPDDLSEYVSDIAKGAIATLCLIPKTEWTDPQTAQSQGAMFAARVGSVGYAVSQGYQADPVPVRGRFL
jgi:hypothetical protein